ncbi:hypothetical protein JOC54_001750 [Alkalihalobacillus xiaoxiensis]|uniref:Yip1 domain-containing protein n=1 Tax=Shouchella xiaoxiensis TaxID=766895 RepID=A0ABS2SVJ5_9BACI|nr:YIP1 family protein [Shouchella xiaoxiensis]MBM7838494.1 hypothetical protein [Shouchella xiaoxiensis]
MEQLKEVQNYQEEFSFSKKPNIFLFLFSPVKQFERLRREPVALGPMFLILGIALIGLLIPVLVGQGGLIPQAGTDMYIEDGMYMDEFYYEEPLPLGSFNLDQFLSGALVWGSVLAIFAAAPPLIALLFLAFARMQSNKVTYGKLYSLTVFTMLPVAIGFLYLMTINAINGTYGYIYTAPSVFVPQENLFYPLLSSLEISTLAFIILVVVGLIKVADFNRFPAFAIGTGMFAVVFVIQLVEGVVR